MAAASNKGAREVYTECPTTPPSSVKDGNEGDNAVKVSKVSKVPRKGSVSAMPRTSRICRYSVGAALFVMIAVSGCVVATVMGTSKPNHERQPVIPVGNMSQPSLNNSEDSEAALDLEHMFDEAVDVLMEHWRSRKGGSPEWLVWDEKPVEVRSRKSTESALLTLKQPGSRIIGQRDGPWLKLEGEIGYILISPGNADEARVRQRKTGFIRIPNGTCTERGHFRILDPITCKAAGEALRLENETEKAILRHLDDEGCKVMGAVGSICCTHLCLPPTTTTTTTTSTSTSTTLTRTSTTTSHTSTTTTYTSTTSTTTTRITTTVNEGKPSLFCFAVIRALSYEVVLIRAFYPYSVSIFGCNSWSVYSDQKAWLGDNTYSVQSDAPKAVYVGLWLNVNIFMNAWKKIFAAQEYMKNDWTVKVDPDAVFLPNRLREHLKPFNGGMLFFRNCPKFSSMQGPLEVLSRDAVANFGRSYQNCVNGIDQSHIGEDGFLQKCMEMLGVGSNQDWSLLVDKYCGQEPSPCTNGWAAAFHPFKDVNLYAKCLNETGDFHGKLKTVR